MEWYCLAVHKNTCERTVEYAGVKKTNHWKSSIHRLLSSYSSSFMKIFCFLDTSSNHTPGSRSYSNLVATWTDCLHPPACTQGCSKASIQGRRLANTSFQLMYISHTRVFSIQEWSWWCTIYREIFAVKNFLWLSVTAKISRTKFFLQRNSLPDPRDSLSSSIPS